MLGSKSDLLPPNRVFYAQRLKDYSNTRKQVRSYSLEMEYYYFLIDFTLVKGSKSSDTLDILNNSGRFEDVSLYVVSLDIFENI